MAAFPTMEAKPRGPFNFGASGAGQQSASLSGREPGTGTPRGRAAWAIAFTFVVLLVGIPATAEAVPDSLPNAATLIEFDVSPSTLLLRDVELGADGNIWFNANPGQGNAMLGRVTSTGRVSTFAFPDSETEDAFAHGATDLVLAPDGNVWFTKTDGVTVGRIDPAGQITEIPLAIGGFLNTPIVGADGALWFSRLTERGSVGSIVRVDMDGRVSDFPIPSQAQAIQLVAGSDGNVWFSAWASTIGRVTPAGVITLFTSPGLIHAGARLQLGQDGNIWFGAEIRAAPNEYVMAHLTPDGEFGVFPVPDQKPVGLLILGGDGRMWFTQAVGDDNRAPFRVVAMSTTGTSAVMSTAVPQTPLSIETGPDGSVFVNEQSNEEAQDAAITKIDLQGRSTRFPLASGDVQEITWDRAGDLWLSDAARSAIGHLVPTSTDRVSGENRYATANAVAILGFAGSAPVVDVATGETFPDALSAAPAAVRDGAPLLLTTKSSLPESVEETIRRLQPAKIVVVGGIDSVSEGVLRSLRMLQSNTVRLGGADRYEASRSLVRAAFGTTGAPLVYVATGADYPDALVAGAAGGVQGAPVILLEGSPDALDPSTRALLEELGTTRIKIAGGPASVSAALEADLASIAPTTRLFGADRFEAAQAVNRDAFGAASRVFLATGFKFPDGLTGSAWAGSEGAPLYVVPRDCVPRLVLADTVAFRASKVTVIGGTDSVSSPVDQLTPCVRSASDPVR